jgi:hypothetical protein
MATASLMPVKHYKSRLFLSLGNMGRLNILDKKSGSHLKTISGIGTEWFSSAFVENGDHLWFTTTSGLYKISVSGEVHSMVKNDERIGSSMGSFTNGMSIDYSTGLLYTTRGNDFVCLNIEP